MYRSVLAICTANVCRSPMAEALFAELMRKPDANRSIARSQIGSAGITAPSGSPAADFSVEVLAERGIDISAHRARQLSPTMIKDFDLCLVMENHQRDFLVRLSPEIGKKVFLIGHWGDFEIPDPVGEPKSVFNETLSLIERGVTEWLPYLSGSGA